MSSAVACKFCWPCKCWQVSIFTAASYPQPFKQVSRQPSSLCCGRWTKFSVDVVVSFLKFIYRHRFKTNQVRLPLRTECFIPCFRKTCHIHKYQLLSFWHALCWEAEYEACMFHADKLAILIQCSYIHSYYILRMIYEVFYCGNKNIPIQKVQLIVMHDVNVQL